MCAAMAEPQLTVTALTHAVTAIKNINLSWGQEKTDSDHGKMHLHDANLVGAF